MRGPPTIALAALLLTGCPQFHLRDTEGRPGPSEDGGPRPIADGGPRPADAAVDAPPPDPPICPPRGALGSVTVSVAEVEVFEGCDDRCVVVHDIGGPELDPDALEALRARVALMSMEDDVRLEPCCPSRGEASGLCVVVHVGDEVPLWSSDVECPRGPAFPAMWMFAVAEARGCFAVRVER